MKYVLRIGNEYFSKRVWHGTRYQGEYHNVFDAIEHAEVFNTETQDPQAIKQLLSIFTAYVVEVE